MLKKFKEKGAYLMPQIVAKLSIDFDDLTDFESNTF
jgi:hypothetical protein